MKVIILKTNEIKEVSLGYAVNYLLPKKLAVAATEKKLAELKEKALKVEASKSKEERVNKQEAERLDGKVIEFKKTAGKAGKIHGSITKKEIAKALKILKTNVILAEPIKKIGEYEVELKFGKIKPKVKVKVCGVS
ncbi:MAG: 50S ribosomal protein L9 [Candidatus Beckwithbacteria bacterium GW2011_GWA2_43_10]|uniref:Large ribosomal subunit protein bL9 n=1 Tax=Candidatus Beckwithbacteria bacterium GW2011_GWA2_43_10 TaxID=1618369 RepID=A0A0G1C0S5_9BACT|nr:MAG: 50S ribosomal protein L9 [Candidatus Beckwithbacteria bacterium GW2011_GWA2_43_10]